MLRTIDWRSAARWWAIRIAALPVIFVVVSFVSFFLISGPGSDGMTDRLYGDFRKGDLERLRERLGLNDPWLERYVDWLADAARGDLGTVYLTQVPVRTVVADRWNESAELLLVALACAAIVGAGLAYARRQYRGHAVDHLARAITYVIEALPVFLVGTLVLLLPAERWGYSPPLEDTISFFDRPWDHLRQFAPPALVMSATAIGVLSRSVIRTAASGKGIAFATLVSLPRAIPILIADLLVIELMFNIGGLGLFFFDGTIRLDSPVMQAMLTLAMTVGVASWLFVPAEASAHEPVTAPSVPGWRSPWLFIGAGTVGIVLLLGIIGPHVAPHDAAELGVGGRLENPSLDHPFAPMGARATCSAASSRVRAPPCGSRSPSSHSASCRASPLG
jgi:peptide/nickel transport system permease protein